MRLHAYEWGGRDLPPVVCLHGVRGHGLRFRKLAEQHLGARFRVISFDLRGHGHSGWEPPWNIETHIQDVRDTAAAAQIEAARWIGHSFGGRLILELADRHPELVERLILLDPAIQLTPTFGLDSADAERPDLTFSSPDEAIQYRLNSGTLVHTPQDLLVEEMEQNLVRFPDGQLRFRYSPSAVVAAWGEMVREPPALPRLPTLLVLAEQSIVAPEQAAAYRDAVGDHLETVTVPGGHIVLWDAFDDTARAIDTFLA